MNSKRRKKNHAKGCLIALGCYFLIGLLGTAIVATVDALNSEAVQQALLGFAAFVFLVLACFPIWQIYKFAYFHGRTFKQNKQAIADYITECNELNEHILSLESAHGLTKRDYCEVYVENKSRFRYKKQGLKDLQYAPNIIDLRRADQVEAVRIKPFEALCKHLNIDKKSEATLEQFNTILSDFLSIEEGKGYLHQKYNDIVTGVKAPFLIRRFCAERLAKELGFDSFIFDEVNYPTFIFRYVSPGGNSNVQYPLVLDMPMQERFIAYLDTCVKHDKSAKHQRALMTPAQRHHILDRDNHTCKLCGNSTVSEPNLLLEIDHIIPVAKGGLTSEDNLQTLCWKCNRSKGVRI